MGAPEKELRILGNPHIGLGFKFRVIQGVEADIGISRDDLGMVYGNVRVDREQLGMIKDGAFICGVYTVGGSRGYTQLITRNEDCCLIRVSSSLGSGFDD